MRSLVLACMVLAGTLFADKAVLAQEFENSYALIVGVDDYPGFGLQHLRNAQADATAVARYFTAQHYRVTALIGSTNATKAKVRAAVGAIAQHIGERDRFVFFFAGHGKAKRTEGVDVAYLLVPGGRDKNDPESLLSTGDIVDFSHRLDRARHQLFIFDSCYAGLMGQFETRASDDGHSYDSETFLVRDLSARRAREYLSAGGEDQEVLDNGPGRLSWFTYFLLKGMEPGVVNRRASGLITFTELASYVQATSANPKHTPAFGSLAGHHGGDYLLLSTARGTPQLPALPDISRQTLLDMGFLTRGEAPAASVAPKLEHMREPIDRLFQAWRDKDLALYMRQFDRRVVQTGRLKIGATFSRGYDAIAAQRKQLFARLDHVDVLKYEVMYQGSDAAQTTFGVRYSLDFHWRDGTVKHELNINECYRLRELHDEQRWVITRNDDYQNRICYR